MADDNFIKDWLEGKLSSDDLQKRKSADNPEVNQYEEIIRKSHHLKVPGKLSKEQAWEKLSGRLNTEVRPQGKSTQWSWWVPVAAAATFTIVISYFFFFTTITIETQKGERLVHKLPDGSEVLLNADSKISFKNVWWTHNRTINLQGEAFFNVTRGRRFKVVADSLTVTVLGTTFNINTRPETAEVACFTGKVRVTKANEQVVLKKGQYTKVQTNALTPAEKFDQEKKASWRKGEFYFEGAPLSQVIEELERQFDISIQYDGNGERLYTGYFNTRKLDDALKMVFQPMSLRYHKANDKSIIVE